MSEHLRSQTTFTPADMGKLLIRNGVAAGAVSNKAPEASAQEAATVPYEGKVVHHDGRDYRYTAVTAQVFNRGTGRFEPKPLTLRTWFSHSTPEEGIDMGPGWGSQFHLGELTPSEQMERYGHVFSLTEIQNPRTMPNDIPYFDLEPLEDSPQGPAPAE